MIILSYMMNGVLNSLAVLITDTCFTFILILSLTLTIMSINHNCLVTGCNEIYLWIVKLI